MIDTWAAGCGTTCGRPKSSSGGELTSFFFLCFFLTTQSVESEILIIIKCLCFHSSFPKPCWIIVTLQFLIQSTTIASWTQNPTCLLNNYDMFWDWSFWVCSLNYQILVTGRVEEINNRQLTEQCCDVLVSPSESSLF
jgi:hypothetical protein